MFIHLLQSLLPIITGVDLHFKHESKLPVHQTQELKPGIYVGGKAANHHSNGISYCIDYYTPQAGHRSISVLYNMWPRRGSWTQDQKVWGSIPSTGHVLKCWEIFVLHIASIHPAVMVPGAQIQRWINSCIGAHLARGKVKFV